MKTSFSIIIPTYNRPNEVYRAVKSIIAQDYQNVEVIVIDDNSVERIDLVLEEFIKKSEVIYLRNEINQGVSKNRNLGIAKVQNEYVIFLDDDDYHGDDSLDKLNQIISENNEPQLVYFQTRGKFSTNENSSTSVLKREKFDQEIFTTSKYNYVWKFAFYKKVIEGIKFDETINIGEDIKFTFDVTRKVDDIYLTQLELIYQTQTPNSLSRGVVGEKQIKLVKDDLANWLSIFKRTNLSLSFLYKRLRKQWLYYIEDLKRNEIAAIKELFINCINENTLDDKKIFKKGDYIVSKVKKIIKRKILK